MKTLYVVRHAESIHHIENRVGGWYDTALSSRGKKQAEATAGHLVEMVRDESVRVYSSDLLRSSQTAEFIAGRFAVDVQCTRNLRELSNGNADGMPQEWLLERLIPPPREGDRMDHATYAGAESRRDLAERVYPEV